MKRFRARRRAAFGVLVFVLAVVLTLTLRARAPVVPPMSQVRAAGLVRSAPVRAVTPRWGAASQAELRATLAATLAGAIHGAQAWSCVVLSHDGTVLFDDHSHDAVVPASVQKLVVADAALTRLGTDFRFSTIFAAKQPPRNGAIDGDLWFAGSGDPSLRNDEIAGGVRALASAGVHAINGAVVADPTAIAGEEINPLWNAGDGNEDFMTATSGLSIDGDTVEFDITGTSAGEPAAVQVKPASSAVRYYGAVDTGGGDDVIVAATQRPNQFRLAGNVPPGVRERFWVPVHGIPQYAARVTTDLLKDAGVRVARAPLTGTVPLDTHVLWEHRSKPLREIVKHMLIFSDNHFAEQLMRTVGATDGAVADDRSGVAAERNVLGAQAIPTPGLHLVDGSGLAHANRIAAITLARILARFEADARGNALYSLLPRGGLDGTLKMYRFSSAAGRVRAKSGHLEDASSLAGYVETRKHGRVIFAFMVNGSPGDPDAAIVAALDQLAQR